MAQPVTAWARDAYDQLWGSESYTEDFSTACAIDVDEEEAINNGEATAGPATKQQRLSYSVLLNKMDWAHKIQPFVVRDEYEEIFDLISSPTFVSRAKERSGGLVVWGNPGIGKSTFLRYAAARSLSEKEPTLFIPESTSSFFFSEVGVEEIVSNEAPSRFRIIADKYPGLLALVDSNATLKSLPPDLENRRMRIVQASSPRVSRYKDWMKERKADFWIIDMWSVTEVMIQMAAMKEAKMPPTAFSPLDQLVWAGPVARVLFDPNRLQQSPHTNIEESGTLLKDLFRQTDPGTLASRFRDQQGADSGFSGVQELFMITRRPNKPKVQSYRSRPSIWGTLTCISLSIERDLMDIFQEREIDETLTFASKLSATPQIAGVVYEAAAIRILPSKVQAYKGFSFEGAKAPSELILPDAASPSRTPLPIVIPEQGQSFATTLFIVLHELYTPDRLYPTFDALVCTESHVTLFQMTIAKKRDVKPEGITRLFNAVSTQMQDLSWRLIFVVPSHEVGQKMMTAEREKGIKFGPKLVTFGYVVFSLVKKEHQQGLNECSKNLLASM